MFEIGNSLREARLRQHLDFDAAEHATKIRGKYLRALEDEQFDLLPAETYVRGFLRTYAEFLGLDGQLYVDEYNSRFVLGEDEPALPGRPRRSQGRPGTQRRLATSAVAAALVGITAVAALVILAWKFGGGGSSPTYPGLGNSTPVTNAGSSAPRKPRPRRVQLVLTAATGASWIQVRAGSVTGRELYRGTLEVGQTQRFRARRLWLRIAAPSNLRAQVNGRRTPIRGGRAGEFVATRTGVRRAG